VGAGSGPHRYHGDGDGGGVRTPNIFLDRTLEPAYSVERVSPGIVLLAVVDRYIHPRNSQRRCNGLESELEAWLTAAGMLP
jgi:hypothetical protein